MYLTPESLQLYLYYYITLLYYLTVQFSTKNHETCKETGKYTTSRGKKQPRENVPEKGPILDLVNTDFKSVIINILKKN